MNILTYTLLVFTMALWGGTFIAGRLLAGGVEPANAAFLRFLIASITLIILLKITGKNLTIPKAKYWLSLVILGFTGVFCYNVCFFYGLQFIGGGRASLIIASTPLVITFFAWIFLKERLTPSRLAGIIISLIGAIVVISNGNPAALWNGGFGRGEQAIVGCVLSWAIYSIVGKSVLKSFSPLLTVCYSSIIGTLMLAIPAINTGLLDSITTISPQSWLSLTYLGVCGTAVGFSLYYHGIKKIGAARAGIFINLVPLFSLLLSWYILAETIKPLVLAGGVLVLFGVTVTNYVRK